MFSHVQELRGMYTVDRAHNDAMLTPGEVAGLFDVTPKTIGRWEAAGFLQATRTAGGHRRFRAGDVSAWFDYLTEVGAS
jgi:excisionase family DNA binding protein